jgi:hypothetical protein
MLAVHCTQVGITEDINHEVFRSLLENQNSCALYSQVALSYFYASPRTLEPPFLGNSGEAFSHQLSVMRTVVQPLWLNEGMEVFPQMISGLFV